MTTTCRDVLLRMVTYNCVPHLASTYYCALHLDTCFDFLLRAITRDCLRYLAAQWTDVRLLYSERDYVRTPPTHGYYSP